MRTPDATNSPIQSNTCKTRCPHVSKTETEAHAKNGYHTRQGAPGRDFEALDGQ